MYNVSDWQYGFSTAIETYGEPSQLAFYVTKYITKDVKKIFGKFFWSSKNIKREPKITYADEDFSEILPVVSPMNSNTAYQYESSITYNSLGSDSSQAILDYLKEKGLE